MADAHCRAVGDEDVPRRQLVDVLVDGRWRRHVEQRQIGVERLGTPGVVDGRVLKNRFDLGTEDQAAVGQPRVVERLDADSIARQEQPLPRRVPYRKREHAAKALDARIAPFLVSVDDDLGVGMRPEAMPAALELGPQRREVVDLAVEDDQHRAVLVGERLLTSGDIDDAQAAVGEPDAFTDEEAVGVGSAMRHGIGHRAQQPAFDGGLGRGGEFSSDATHS